MENKFTLVSLCLLMGMGTAFAQNTQVKGNVVDEKGEPVIGASIVVKGTTVGTVLILMVILFLKYQVMVKSWKFHTLVWKSKLLR